MEKPQASGRDRNVALRWHAGEMDPAVKRRRVRQRRRYKLSVEAMNELWEKQEGKCAICRIDLTKPVVDHSHITGKIRGLLCASCNTGLGQFDDSEKFLIAAIKYLRRHPDDL